MTEQFELFRQSQDPNKERPSRIEVVVDGTKYSIVRISDGKLKITSRRGGIGYAFGREDLEERKRKDARALEIAEEQLQLAEEDRKAS